MTAMGSPIYRWRVGEVQITRVLEFEAALFEQAVIHPKASPEIIARHRTWLEPTLMDPASGLLVFAFHSTVIRTPRADRGLMALAGLWETWRSPAGERVRSFAIITTTPNELCAELHHRMPVVLSPDVWSEWLGEEPADPARLKALLAPYPAEEMAFWPVSTRVGNVKNNDPSLIEPVALAA